MTIKIKKANRGLLHQNLGVPAGDPISSQKLAKAKKTAGPAEKKRIVFAQNAKSWNRGSKRGG